MSDTAGEPTAPEQDDSIPSDAVYCVSGLVYRVLERGTGRERPGPDDLVQVVYRAWTETGQLIDASGDDDAPATLSVRHVMPGLAEALQLMTVGRRLRAWIPPHLASDELQSATGGAVIYDITLVAFTRTREYPPLPNELTSPRKDFP